MEFIDLPKKQFKVAEMQRLEKEGQLKDNLDCINYIFKYYYEIGKGSFYYYNYSLDTFEIITKQEFKDEVISKLDNEKIIEKQIKKNNKIFSVVCKIGKPRIYKENDDYFINESGAFMHQKYKNFDEYDDKIKEGVYKMLNFMKTMSCSGNEEVFNAYKIYYAQLARGMKTEVVIIRKSTAEGIGKSIEPEFFYTYVFGEKVCLRYSKLDAFITDKNKIFLGKIYVIVDDIQKMNDNEYGKFGCSLKTLTTERRTTFRDVYEKPIQADNISNFQLTTNFSINDSGRRIIMLDLSLEYMQNTTFFGDLKKTCFNNEVGEAFFSYLLTKITDEQCNKFYAQRDFPITESKKELVAMSLPYPYKFLKESYILQKRNIEKTLKTDFYKEFVKWCQDNNKRETNQIDFFQKMEEVGIKTYNSCGYKYVKKTFEELNEMSIKNKWICKFDDYITDDEKELKSKNNNKSDLDYGLELENKDQEIDKKNEEIDKLKKEIEELKKLLQQKQEPVKPDVIIHVPQPKKQLDYAIDDLDLGLDKINENDIIIEEETKYKFGKKIKPEDDKTRAKFSKTKMKEVKNSNNELNNLNIDELF